MRKILINLKNNLVALMFTILGIELIFESIYGEYKFGFVISIIFLTTIFFCFFDKVKEVGNKGPLLYIPLAIIIIFLSTILIYTSSDMESVGFLPWLFNGGTQNGEIYGYIMASLLLITFLFSSMLYYFLIVIIRMPVLLLLFFIVAILNIRLTYIKGNLILIAFLLNFLLLFFENTKVKALPDIAIIRSRKRDINFAGLIVLVIMFIIAIALPNIKFPKINALEDIKRVLNYNGDTGKNGNFIVGQGNRSINESNNFDDDSVLYSFIGDNPNYLISQTYNRYKDQQWENDDPQSNSVIKINSKERNLLFGTTEEYLKKYDGVSSMLLNAKDAKTDDSLKKSLTIRPESAAVKFIPHPENTVLSYSNENTDGVYFDIRNILYKDELFGVNDSLNMLYISEYPMENSKQDIVIKNFDRSELVLIKGLSEDTSNLDNYKTVHNYYLINNRLLNDTINSEVKDLANEIVQDSKSTYDKAKAIEEYFHSGEYLYDLELPEKNPVYKDYIDYFILEGKTGYCVQYATAMTLMCLEEGIAARYAEGYVVSESDKSQNGRYLVTANKGHAFVEVYIEGYGWKIFDPTPGLSNGESSNVDEDKVIINKENKSLDLSLITNIMVVLIVIILLVGILFLYIYLTKRKRFIKGVRKRNPNEALEIIINNSIKELKKAGIEPNKMETLLKFSIRVDKEYGFNLREIVNIYYLNKYKEIIVGFEDVEKAISVNQEIYTSFNK